MSYDVTLHRCQICNTVAYITTFKKGYEICPTCNERGKWVELYVPPNNVDLWGRDAKARNADRHMRDMVEYEREQEEWVERKRHGIS
jgi:hypothetical protein